MIFKGGIAFRGSYSARNPSIALSTKIDCGIELYFEVLGCRLVLS